MGNDTGQQWGLALAPKSLLSSFRERVARSHDEGSPRRATLGECSTIHMSQEQAQQYFLKKEVAEARIMIRKLEEKCEAAVSYREKSSKLLEEALRALGRLEQAMTRKGCEDLILAASEIKASVQQGITLVKVYGKHGTLVKMATIVMRKSIYAKYDQVIEKLSGLVQHCNAFPLAPSTPALSAQRTPSHSTASDLAAQASKPLARNSPSLLSAKPSARDLAAKDAPQQAEGVVIRPAKHDKVHAIAFVPPHLSSSFSNIWWSAGSSLEYWMESTGSTTTFMVDKDTMVVTAVQVDEQGNVWTGHVKGLVRVRPRFSWDQGTEDKVFGSAVRCIAFDENGCAWVGDNDGKVKVIRYHRRNSRDLSASGVGVTGVEDEVVERRPRLEVVATLRQSMMGRLSEGAKSMLPGVFNLLHGRQPCHAPKGSSSDRSSPQAMELMHQGPVRVLLVKDGRAWIGGGLSHCTPWLVLFDASTYQDLDVYECRVVGAITVMASINWPQNCAGNCPRALDRQASCPAALPPASWRLITGHENGQLMLWHPRADRLAPLIRIGDVMSPVRGIHVCESLSLVITGHQNGEMHMFVQQRLDMMLTPGADSVHPDSLGTVRPKKLVMKAHKSNLVSLVGSSSCFCTASSQGTIRVWQMADVSADVQRAGLLTWGASPSLSASASAALALANSTSGPSGVQQRLSLPVGVPSAAGTATEQLSHAASMQSSQGMDLATNSGGGGLARVPRSQSDAEQQVAADMAQRQGSISNPAISQPPTSSSSAGNDRASRLRRHSSGMGPMVGEHLHDVASERVGSGSVGNASSLTPSAAQHTFSSACQTIDQSELTLRRVIGMGAYGKVWLAEWTGCAVAVKELLGFGSTADDSKLWAEMQNEVHMLGTYNHPNIMRFMAVCLVPPMIVMQYYPHGSLFDLLSRARAGNARAVKELAWNKRLDMMRDVAAGMHYLHTRKPPVIHGDLRSPNLLLDLTIDRERPRFHVKIADFGLARMLGPSSSLIMVSKTTNPRWTAPEVIKSSQIGPAGDVYSFAIILWEVLTWQQPYEDMMSIQVILRTVTDHDRPITPPDHMLPGSPGVTLPDYKTLMERCWAADPTQRPSFKQIVDMFQNMRDTEARAARSGSGAPRAGSGGSTGANDGVSSVLVSPNATPGTPGSNSASSVKSDQAAVLLSPAGAAKDSASSFTTPEGGRSSAGKVGGGGAGGLAGPQASMGGASDASSQRSSAAATPRGNMFGTMSPIVEERSVSMNLVDTNPHAQSLVQALQPPSAQPAAASAHAPGWSSPFATALTEQANIAANNNDLLLTRNMPSFLGGPINLLDGDDGTDPLEAYRSGALEEFGYSKSGIFMQSLVNTYQNNVAVPLLSKLEEGEEDASLASDRLHQGDSSTGVGTLSPRPSHQASLRPQPSDAQGSCAPWLDGTETRSSPQVAFPEALHGSHPTSPRYEADTRSSPLTKVRASAPLGGEPGPLQGWAQQLPASPATSSPHSAAPSKIPEVWHRASRSYDQAELNHVVAEAVDSPKAGASLTQPSRSSLPNRVTVISPTGHHGHGSSHPSRLGLTASGTHPGSPLSPTKGSPSASVGGGGAGHLPDSPIERTSARHQQQQQQVERRPSDASVRMARGGSGGSLKGIPSGLSRNSVPNKGLGGRASGASTPAGSRGSSPNRTVGSLDGRPSAGRPRRNSLCSATASRPAPMRATPHTPLQHRGSGTPLPLPLNATNTSSRTPAKPGRSASESQQQQQRGYAQRMAESPARSSGGTGRNSRPSSPRLKPVHSADLAGQVPPRSLSRSSSQQGDDERHSVGSSPRGSVAAHLMDASPRVVALNNITRQGSVTRARASQIPNAPSSNGSTMGSRYSGGGMAGIPLSPQPGSSSRQDSQVHVGKPYAPLSAFSPFSNTAPPLPSRLSAGGTPNSEAIVTLGGAAAVSGPAAVVQEAAAAPAKAPSPSPSFAAQHLQQSAGSGQRGSSTSGAAVERVYAPLSKFSPFAQAPAADGAEEQASATAAVTDPVKQGEERVYAPLSKFSPFAQAPAPTSEEDPPLGAAGGNKGAAVSAAGQATAIGPCYAPLSKFSPFAQAAEPAPPAGAAAQGSVQAPVATAATDPPAAAAPCYAPLSKFSPFAQASQSVPDESQAQPVGVPTSMAGASADCANKQQRGGQVWAPLTAYSPFSTVQQQESGSQQELEPAPAKSTDTDVTDHVVVRTTTVDKSRDGKPYAPLSAHSPFSGAAAFDWA